MQNEPVKDRPAYAIESVDHALRLATLLQHEGPLGVSEAARRLGVARSTAHRGYSVPCGGSGTRTGWPGS